MGFIEKAKNTHGDKYNYSLVNYKNNYTKVIIICPIHGEFEQTPNIHLSGHGCKKCSKFCHDNKILTNNFIEKAKNTHGDKYDYSLVDYKNNKTKIKIICPIHGEFEQQPNHHLNGSGCKKCNAIASSDRQRSTKNNFIEKAKNTHGDKYDYSLVDYKNNKTKIKIICPIHGEFEQQPAAHINKQGCPKCGRDSTSHNHKITKSNFIKKAKEIHGGLYDYNNINYIDYNTEIVLNCTIHGDFKTIPKYHINNKVGCIKCSDNSWNKNDFIKKAKKIHGDRYNYSLVNYKNSTIKVDIICKKHGVFSQSPYNHISGSGCHKCSLSTIQNQIFNYIKNICDYDIEINNRTLIRPHEIDILIPNQKFGIEFNGNYWHSFDKIESPKEKNKHQEKTLKCINKGIKLFNIWEHQWNSKQELIKSMISGKLNLNNRVYARKCKIININNNIYKKFMNENHLQGYVSSSIKYGLLLNNNLVCAIGINKSAKYEWEISRFASAMFTNVIGGFSKLLSHFSKNHNPNKIMSYANLDHSNGNLYVKNGFVLDGISKPGYNYYKNKTVFSRQKFQKQKLKSKLNNFDEKLSESQNMFNNGYRRLWNCGNLRFIKHFN